MERRIAVARREQVLVTTAVNGKRVNKPEVIGSEGLLLPDFDKGMSSLQSISC